jgi:hypothetical protein
MSLDYFLLCKEGYENIIQHLDSIIHIYKDIEDITTDFLEFQNEESKESAKFVDVMLDPQKQINIQCFIDKRNYISQMKLRCNKKIYELCVHNFVEDSIDITPDRSQNIRYCSICDFTIPSQTPYK